MSPLFTLLTGPKTWLFWGAVLAGLSVVVPALPLGPLASQPPWPLAALWAAYGWANRAEAGWRAPLALAALGLVHDHLAQHPYGFFATLYPLAYLVSRVIGITMSSAPLGGFVATCAAMVAIASVTAPWALGGSAPILAFALSCAVTAALYGVVRELYESDGRPTRRNS